jgi:hypothetical protein
MVAGAIAGNISAEATTPTGNTFAEAMRGECVEVLEQYELEIGRPRRASMAIGLDNHLMAIEPWLASLERAVNWVARRSAAASALS